MRPTVIIQLADTRLCVGETTTVTFTFNTPVTGFTLDDVNLTHADGALGALTANADRTVWSATFTPTANTSSSPYSIIGVNLGGVTSDTGETGAGVGNSGFYTVDTQRPGVTITLADTRLTVGETTTVTFTFSEFVRGFSIDDIDLSAANGQLSRLTADAQDLRIWRATFTPKGNTQDADNRISVNLAGVADMRGNAGEGSASSDSYQIDTTGPRPNVTITLLDDILSIGETTTVTFTFNQPVTGFTFDDIVLSDAHGTLGPLSSTDGGTTWTARITPASDITDATNTIGVKLAGVTNAAGLAGEGQASSGNYQIDTQRPSVAITLADNHLGAGETTTVTFTFSEPVTGSPIIDLRNANGTLGPLTADADGRTWRATFTPTANVSDATNTIGVNLDSVTDAAGNRGGGGAEDDWMPRGRGLAYSDNYTVDTVAGHLDVAIALSDSALKIDDTATVTFTFSEPVTGLPLNAIDLSHASGTLSEPTASADGRTWSATFMPTDDTEGARRHIDVDLARVTTSAGTTGLGVAASASYSVDTKRPDAAIWLTDINLVAGETTTVTFSFREPVTGFTLDDIDLSHANGTLGPLTADADGRTWRATFTPTANIADTTNTIGVNLGGVTDIAGNTGTGQAVSANYRMDTTVARPTATITLADTTLTAGETTTVTFTFNEAVTGFALDDIILTNANGALSPLRADADGRTWRATFTPTANISDTTNTIGVNLGGVTNAAGNTGAGTASSDNYSIDTTGLAATITLADTTLTAGETTTVTFSFSEAVTGFTLDDVILTHANGALGPLTANADRTVWYATFTPDANARSTPYSSISLNLDGVSNAAGRAGAGQVASSPYLVDTQRPSVTITLADTSLTVGETTTVTFTFSEFVTGFTLDDIIATNANGSLSPLTADADGRTWRATFTPTANISDATNTIGVNLGGVTDAAGNTGTGTLTSTNYTIDTRPPDTTPQPPSPAVPSPPPPAEPTKPSPPTPAKPVQPPGIPVPDGAVPADGNADGIKDSEQPAVGSIQAVARPGGESNPADTARTVVTLVVGSQDGKLIPGSNAQITSLEQKDTPQHLPRGLEMPIGLVSFKAALTAGRSSETCSLYVDAALGINGYWVQDRSGTWVNLASAPYGGKMAMEGGRLRLDFQIEDGGQFDADGKIDSVITAPGAAARMPLSIVGHAPDELQNQGYWF